MAGVVLTDKQRRELHEAMLEYMVGAGFGESAAVFGRETGLAVGTSSSGMLEKKWTSILRLQKKVMGLESRIKELESESRGGYHTGSEALGGALAPRSPEKHTLGGHRAPICAVCFHPQFSLVASASEDASIKLYDYESGEFDRTLKGHTQAVLALAFSPNGQLLASTSADLTVKLWDMTSFSCVKTLHGHDHSVSGVAFHPSGDFLLTSSRDKSIRVWELATGFCTSVLSGHDDWVRRVSMAPEGEQLVSCSQDRSVRIWQFGTRECAHILRGHDHVVECVAWSPKDTPALEDDRRTKIGAVGQYIASGARDKTIRIWNAATGQCVAVLAGHDNWVRGVAFLPRQQGEAAKGVFLLSVSDDKSIRLWDLVERRCIKSIQDAHAHFVTCLDLCLRKPLLATGGVDNVSKIWELA